MKQQAAIGMFLMCSFSQTPALPSAQEAGAAVAYWAAAHIADRFNTDFGNWTSTTLVRADGFRHQLLSGNVKHFYNGIAKYLFATTTGWLPEALNKESMRGTVYEAGRQFGTIQQAWVSFQASLQLWQRIAQEHDTVNETAHHALVSGIGGIYAGLGFVSASVAFLIGEATRDLLHLKKSAKVSVARSLIDEYPLKKMIQVTLGTTYASFLKPFMLQWVKDVLSSLSLYDDRYQSFYEAAYQFGDRAFWATEGVKNSYYGVTTLWCSKEGNTNKDKSD
jgi:hypothetical protein